MTVETAGEHGDRYVCDCCKKEVVADLRSAKYNERIREVFGHFNSVNVTFEGGYSLHLDICLECMRNGAKLPTLIDLQVWAKSLFR